MKKIAVTLLALVMSVCLVFGFAACGGDNSNGGNGGDSGIVSGDNTGDNSENGGSGGTTEEKKLPTAAEIVAARNSATSQTVNGYDFKLEFTGDFNVLGLGKSLSGKYDGAYRYDGNSDEVAFKRTTSGALLADSTCYVFTSGDTRIKATMDGSEVKKLSVESPEEQDITMVNLPVVAIVNAVGESNISNITALKNSKYDYSCQVSVGNGNIAYVALGKVFEKLGTGVSFKGIELAANTSTLDFNIDDGKLSDYRLGFKFQISVKAVKVVLDVEYVQSENLTEIALPNTSNGGFVYKTADVQKEVNAINAAIDDLKDDAAYSLDLKAVNELDPGWNKTAIVDSYTARMYKNTDENNNVWFNHSYYYKAHSETDGKETYKYTLGNVNGSDDKNQGTWLISRKGSNTQTAVDGVTADTQFDFLTSMVKQQAGQIDCIKKQTVGDTTTYTVYLGNSATQSVQKKIIDMINTNEYDEVIEVDNYFNTENVVKDAGIKITVKNGKISSIVCETEICYTPTDGDWTEYNVTLNNSIELKVNEKLDKAQAYVAPTKVKGTLGFGKNLNDSEYYIL